MSDDLGSIDCPDCQLQLLQQQQQQQLLQNPPPSSPLQHSSSVENQSTTILHHQNDNSSGLLLRPPSSSSLIHATELGGFPLIGKSSTTPSYSSQVEASTTNHPPYHHQLASIHQNVRAPSSSSYHHHYGTTNNDYGSSSSMSMHQGGTFQPANPSTSSVLHSQHHGTDLNYSSSTGGGGIMEPCDYHGYCSTCAVLDHRPSTNPPRPHVFPPIFYSQGPSSVIPGFSPIGDWTNAEYGHHHHYGSYSATFSSSSQTASSAGHSDIYHQNNGNNSQHGSSSNHVVPPSSSSFEMFSPNNVTSSMLQSSYPNHHQRHHLQQSSTTMFTMSGSNNNTGGGTSRTEYMPQPNYAHHIATSSSSLSIPAQPTTSEIIIGNKVQETVERQQKSDVAVITSIGNSSDLIAVSSPLPTGTTNIVPSSAQHQSQQQEQTTNSSSSDNESSCGDSESDSSSISSEDRELISVVEEDDDDVEEEEEDETESTKGVRPGGKCFICHNPIEITDCSSPQLAKILENIEDDIAVEDLDISGDIEIGGIEDYQGYKKRHASGGCGPGILSTSRLAILLGLSTKNNNIVLGLEPGTAIDHHDVAILCFRCGKLASMADTLERQLASTIQTLQQQLMTNNLMVISPRPPTSLSLNNTTTMGKSAVPLEDVVEEEDYHHHSSSVPSIYPTLQFHHMRSLVHLEDKEVQTTELERRSLGTEISIPQPPSPIPPPTDVHRHESIDAMTQCCSRDFSPQVISFEEASQPSSNQSPSASSTCSNDSEESSSEEEAKEEDDDEEDDDGQKEEENSQTESNEAQFDVPEHATSNNERLETIPIREPPTTSPSCLEHHPSSLDTNEPCPTEAMVMMTTLPQDDPLPEEEEINLMTAVVEQQQSSEEEPQISPHPKYDTTPADLKECTGKKCNDDGDDSMKSSGNDQQPIILESIQNKITSNVSNNLACESCQRIFSTKSNLRAHWKICRARVEEHEEKNNSVVMNKKSGMKCLKCGIGFRSVLRHRQHLEQGCKALNFECNHCQKRFLKASEFKVHVNGHKGQKPFSCEKCGASFATKGNQMAHIKTHLDDKRFFCCHCNKGFNRRFALTVHLNRHNDIKPFPCTLCSKRFSDPSYLTKHKKKAHVLQT